MFDEEGLKTKLITKINLSDDSKDLSNIYMENPNFSFEILSRLLTIKGHNEFLWVWNQNYERIKKDSKELKKIVFSIKEIKEISESKIADDFLISLLDLAVSYDVSFESYKICSLASEIIQVKKQFPSKAWMITYFTLISKLFKFGNQLASYLNALHILNEHQEVQMAKLEFDFYVKVSQLKAEVPLKDLFCGIKTRDFNTIVLSFNDSNFVIDAIWKDIFNLKLENTLENAVFLKKNNLIFQLNDHFLTITPGVNCKFISKIFEIANSYKPTIVNVVSNEVEDYSSKIEQKVIQPTAVLTKEPVKIEFKNRFSNIYKKFKLLHKYAKIEFLDNHFEERKAEKENRTASISAAIEKEKKRLSVYADVINELRVGLKKKNEIRVAEDREKARLQALIDEERMKEERKSNLWRNRKSEVSTADDGVYRPPTFNAQSSANTGVYRPSISTTTEGVYRPNISTSTEGVYRPNISASTEGVYRPNISTSTEGVYRPNISTTAEGAYRPPAFTSQNSVSGSFGAYRSNISTENVYKPAVTAPTENVYKSNVTTPAEGVYRPNISTENARKPNISTENAFKPSTSASTGGAYRSKITAPAEGVYRPPAFNTQASTSENTGVYRSNISDIKSEIENKSYASSEQASPDSAKPPSSSTGGWRKKNTDASNQSQTK